MLGRRLGLVVAALLGAVAGSLPMALQRLSSPPAAVSEPAPVAALRQALEGYRADHGWYPGDPDRDWNSDGRADLLVRQLTEFTRDDGRPADQRDPDYCFGPYLRELPREPHTGSGAIVLDQDHARSLSRLRADVAAGTGRGGWYYEARTGNIVPNHGRARLAATGP